MTDYLECYNFFKECRAFALKHERFMTACKRIREQNEKVDPKLLYALAELFVDIKREMESTCIEHKCIVNLYDTDEDMQSDISSIPESENDDMEEGSSTDESDNEDLSSEFHHVALQLLDLMHTLHTRAAQIHFSCFRGNCL